MHLFLRFGAPVGLRLAVSYPERVTALISQNGNAYEEGLSQGWNPIQKYWKEPTAENRAALGELLNPEAIQWQAEKFGPGIGGLFLAFPAIFPASATLIEKHEEQRKQVRGLQGTRRARESPEVKRKAKTISPHRLSGMKR